VESGSNPLIPFTPLGAIDWSPDTTIVVGGLTAEDEEVIHDETPGRLTRVDLGGLPPEADLVAFHPNSDGTHLFALDVTVVLGGTLVVGPQDVVTFGTTGYSVQFDGAAAGLPQGAAIDALTMGPGGHLLLSFDTTVDVDGHVFEPEDLAIHDGAGFVPFFDGENAGVPRGLNLDAAHLLETGRLLLSFDGSGEIGGVRFDDEDLLEHDPGTGGWERNTDMSNRSPDWAAADLDALAVEAAPERDCSDGLDNDLDGDIDCDDPDCTGPLAPDGDGDGRTVCGGDCDDGNGTIWTTPGEVRDLWVTQPLSTGMTMLTWIVPGETGGDAPRYDTLRSSIVSDFTVATCVESDDASDTAAIETTDPGPGVAWFYLIRAENDCPAGQGTLGTGTGGTPRVGRSCP